MDRIAYNAPVMLGATSQVFQNAAGMANEREDVLNRTNTLLSTGAFEGQNAETFQMHQQQFLQAFDHLIETVQRYSTTMETVVNNTQALDITLARGL